MFQLEDDSAHLVKGKVSCAVWSRVTGLSHDKSILELANWFNENVKNSFRHSMVAEEGILETKPLTAFQPRRS